MTPLQTCVNVRVDGRGTVSRRGFLRRLTAGGAAAVGLRWSDYLSAYADELKERNRACILLWMAGGPSQFETFDPKPGAPTQGPTKAIPTAVPGVDVADPAKPPDNLLPPVGEDRLKRRLGLLKELEAPLARTGAAPLVRDHQT